MNTKTSLLFTLSLTLAILLAGSGGAESNTPRVFFTNVKDGGAVKIPVLLQWSADNFTMSTILSKVINERR